MLASSNISFPGNLNTKFKEDGTISTTQNENKYTLYDLEKRAIDSLNDFNAKMAILARCTNLTYAPENVNWNIQYTGKKGCENAPNSKDQSFMKVVEALEVLEKNVNAMSRAISKLNTDPPGITDDQYKKQYSSIVNKHAEIVKMQQDISQKLKDIQTLDNKDKGKQYDNSFINDFLNKYNATMYSTMMLTVLATSVAYYAFLHL